MKAKTHRAWMAAVFVAIFFAAPPSGAAAGMLWNWSYINAGTNIKAAGTLTTEDLAAESYAITGIAGAWNGTAIEGLEPLHSCCSPPGWNNNLLLESDSKLDKGGFAFDVTGGLKINLFFKDGHYAYEIQNGPEISGGVFTATPSKTPGGAGIPAKSK